MEGREEGSWLLGQSMGISGSLLEVAGSSRSGVKHEDAPFGGEDIFQQRLAARHFRTVAKMRPCRSGQPQLCGKGRVLSSVSCNGTLHPANDEPSSREAVSVQSIKSCRANDGLGR